MHPLSLVLAVAPFLVGCFTEYSELSPVAVTGLEPAAQISAGGNHSCALLENGNLSCWGSNLRGQLGTEIIDEDGLIAEFVAKPTYVPMPEDPVEIQAGGIQSCARFADGDVRCWGNNAAGELGFPSLCEGDYLCNALPNTVFELKDAIAIFVGGPSVARRGSDNGLIATGFACAIREDQGVACWGANDLGQASGRPGSTVTEAQTVVDDNEFPIREIAALALGDAHACALEAGGSVRCWGSNSMVQSGLVGPRGRVAGIESAVAVGAGTEHSCVIQAGGGVMCWGNNVAGQCGGQADNGECFDSATFADCMREPQLVSGVANAVQVVAGERHTCARTESGEVYCWGGNQLGQLGNANTSLSLPAQKVPLSKRAVQLSSGDAHSCALHADGTVSCWGRNKNGQVGVSRHEI